MRPDSGERFEAVIDLGSDWSVPVRSPRIRRGHPAIRRPVIWLAVALLILPALGRAEPVRGAGLLLPSRDLRPSSLSMSPELLFATMNRGAGATVWAYALADGHTRWTASVPYPVVAMYPTDDGILLAIADLAGPNGAVGALDAATGRQLWWRTGVEISGLVDHDIGIFLGQVDGQTDSLFALSLRTGRQLWSRPADANESVAFVERNTGYQGPSRLVVGGSDGVVRVLEPATGRSLVETRLAVGDTGAAVVVQLTTADGVVFVRTGDPNERRLIAYDLELRQLWSISGGIVPSPVYGCGPLLCTVSSASMYVLDPATGRRLWYGEGWQGAAFLDGNRMLVASPVSDRLALLDAGTGRLLVDLTGWQELTDTPPTFSHADSASASRVWFATIARGTSRLWVVGAQDGVIQAGCSATTGYVACPLAAGGVMILRMPG